jgi:hypothetical protein
MIKINTKPIELSITSINDLLNNTKAVLSEVSLFAKQLILQKTARGVDWKGIKFKNYTKEYAKKRKEGLKAFKKKKKGAKKRKSKKTTGGLPTSYVDLFVTGHMMGSIKTKVEDETAKLYFASKLEAEKASYHNDGDGVPARHFFDLTPANVAEAQKIVTEWFDNGVK